MEALKFKLFLTSILIFILLGRIFFSLQTPRDESLKSFVGQIFSTTGIIKTQPMIKDFNQVFILETESGQRLRVTTDRFSSNHYGDKVKVEGKLSSPRNFSGEGGRTFDYINYLAKDEIYYEFKAAKVALLESRVQDGLVDRLFEMKERFLENLRKFLGEPQASLAGGLVVGEKSSLGKELTDDFRRAGLIHIVVLSGYNITIIATMVRRFLSFLPRKTSILLGILSIVLFGLLVGGGATVVRSCIMAVIALCGELFRRDYEAKRALWLAGIGMVIQNPLILFYDPSFQLSFLATFGLMVLSKPFEEKLFFVTERFGLRSIIASTLATQVFVSPYILYMMGELSIIGFLVNIVVLPLIPLTMALVFLVGFLGIFSSPIAQIVAWLAHFLLSYELFVVQIASDFPWATISLPAFSLRIVGGIYLVYYSFFLFFKWRKKSSLQSVANLS